MNNLKFGLTGMLALLLVLGIVSCGGGGGGDQTNANTDQQQVVIKGRAW